MTIPYHFIGVSTKRFRLLLYTQVTIPYHFIGISTLKSASPLLIRLLFLPPLLRLRRFMRCPQLFPFRPRVLFFSSTLELIWTFVLSIYNYIIFSLYVNILVMKKGDFTQIKSPSSTFPILPLSYDIVEILTTIIFYLFFSLMQISILQYQELLFLR